MKPRIAVIGTSWWADAMYLPALTHDGSIDVVAVAGRDAKRTSEFAARWSVPQASTDPAALIDTVDADAIIIVTPNETHHPFTKSALGRGLAVLTEKPLAINYGQATDLADQAQRLGVTTMVPFTYSFMPAARYLRHLVETGYIGTPYHLNLRYYSGYARGPQYWWRLDADRAGSGVVGDLGSHFFYLALWYFGPVTDVSATLATLIDRPHPQGKQYEAADDTSIVTLRFANGAIGSVTATAMAYEPSRISQMHELELHGSEGTLRHRVDWDTQQTIVGARNGDQNSATIEIPGSFLQGSPVDDVITTYKRTFRHNGHMVREFAHAASSGTAVRPDFRAGADVQRIIDASLVSHQEGRRVAIEEIQDKTIGG